MPEENLQPQANIPENNPQPQANIPENNPQPQTNTPENNPQPQTTGTTSKEPNKLMGCLSYRGFLFLIPMFALKPEEKDNYIITHIRQGTGVFCIEIIGWFISFLAGILSLSFIGRIGYIFYLIAFVFVILGILNAIKPSSDKLPYIGDFFDKTFNFIKN